MNRKMRGVAAMLLLTVVLCLTAGMTKKNNREITTDAFSELKEMPRYQAELVIVEPTPLLVPTPTPDPSEAIYAYLQGPRAWKEKWPGAGIWGKDYYVDGTLFSNYGCGLCCLANIYSSFTPYECSPIDMYEYAKEASGYPGGGPIDWEFMLETIQSTGFTAHTYRKPDTYKEFQNKIRNSMMSILLISSANDSSYWEDTYGHYITVSLYRESDDTVFLGDSSHPENNRKRIPLKQVYKALKTISKQQGLSVSGYEELKNSWKKKTTEHRFIP